MSKFLTISQLSKLLGLIDPKTGKPLNHILRYWEKEFKEIKPKKINKRRYYSNKQIEEIKKIKFLLKNKGMSISGVKNLLKSNTIKLDDDNSNSLKDDYYKFSLKTKSKLILKKIKLIKSHGKKKLILKSEWCLKAILIVNLSTMRKNPQKVKKQKINLN